MRYKATIYSKEIQNNGSLFLWFVVEDGQNDDCHGQLDLGRLSCLLVVDKLFNLQRFGLLTCQFDLEIEWRL
jgi:hypothetical protein